MSYFGDNTPHQTLLDWTTYTQDEFDLTNEEMAILLLRVLSYFVDSGEIKSEEIRKRKKVR